MFNAIPEAETQILSSRKGRTLQGISKFFQIQRLTNQVVIHSDCINDDTIQHKLFLSNHLLSCHVRFERVSMTNTIPKAKTFISFYVKSTTGVMTKKKVIAYKQT